MKSKPFRQFCDDHQISYPTGYKEIEEGRLRIHKIGSRTMVSDQAERDWIAACENRAVEEAQSAKKRAQDLAANRMVTRCCRRCSKPYKDRANGPTTCPDCRRGGTRGAKSASARKSASLGNAYADLRCND